MKDLMWLIMPALLALPSLSVVTLFAAGDQKKLTALAFALSLCVVAGMLFGWYGTAMYIIIEEALYGKSELFNSPIVRGAGIFISWASSLPIAFLFRRNIRILREGTFVDRALLAFIFFYGTHLVALCVFVIIKGGFAVL